MSAEDSSSSWLGARSAVQGREDLIARDSGSDSCASPKAHINTMDVMNLHAEIVSSETRPEARIIGRKDYTGYLVTVCVPNTGHCWTVLRRYSEFRTLYIALKGTLLPYSGFPQRRVFRNMDAAFVARRRSALDDFIKKVMLLAPEHRRHPAIDSFLELSVNLAQPHLLETPKATDAALNTGKPGRVPAKSDEQDETSCTKPAAEQTDAHNTPAIAMGEATAQGRIHNHTVDPVLMPAEGVAFVQLEQPELNHKILFTAGSQSSSQSSSQSENMAVNADESHVRELKSEVSASPIVAEVREVAKAKASVSVSAAELTVPEISSNKIRTAENAMEVDVDLAPLAGAARDGSLADTEKNEIEAECCTVDAAAAQGDTESIVIALNGQNLVGDSVVDYTQQGCEEPDSSVAQVTSYAVGSPACVPVVVTSAADAENDIPDRDEQADGPGDGLHAGKVLWQHTDVSADLVERAIDSDFPKLDRSMPTQNLAAADDRPEMTRTATPEKQAGTWPAVTCDDAELSGPIAQPSLLTGNAAATEDLAPEESHGCVDSPTGPSVPCYSKGNNETSPVPERMLEDQHSAVHSPGIPLVVEWLDGRMNVQADKWTAFEEQEPDDLWPEEMGAEEDSNDSEDDGYRAFNQDDLEPKYGVGMIELNYGAQEQLEKKALAAKKRCVQFPDVVDFWDAVKEGNVEKVDQFLATNAKEINARSALDFTPLMCAALLGHVSLALYLIHQGADLDAVNFEACTALHYAVIEGDVQIARALMHAGADFTIRDYEGKTPVELTEDEVLLKVLERELQEQGLLDGDVAYSGVGGSDVDDPHKSSHMGQTVGGSL